MSLRSRITLSSCSHGRVAVQRRCTAFCALASRPNRKQWSRHSSSQENTARNANGSTLIEAIASVSPPTLFRWDEPPFAATQFTTGNTPQSSSKPPDVSHRDDESDQAKISEGIAVVKHPQTIFTPSIAQGALDDNLDHGYTHQKDHPNALDVQFYRDWFMAWNVTMEKLFDIHLSEGKEGMDLFHEHTQFAQMFTSGLSGEQIKEKWLSLSTTYKMVITPLLLIGSLIESPAQALFVLANTSFIWNDFHIRMKCLAYLDHVAEDDIRGSPHLKDLFEEGIAICKSPTRWPKKSFDPRHLNVMLRWSTPGEDNLVIQAFLDRYPSALPQAYTTMLMHRLRQGNIEGCLNILSRSPQEFFQDGNLRWREACKELLTHDTVITSESGTNFKILPQLLSRGLEPDREVYNVVLHNAIAQELHSVGWDLYRHIRQQHIAIDARCYSMLLRNAFNQGYIQGLNEVMTDIHESDSLSRDRYLIVYSMNIIRVVSFYQLKSSSTEALTRMMGLYDRAWSRQALEPFRILRGIDTPPETIDLPRPPSASVAFTLWSYILVQRSERLVDKLWQRITQLIEDSAAKTDDADKKTINIFRMDIVYNGFVLFYARKLGTLVQALKVVQHMIDHELCQPSPRTWSMLVCGFLRHHQVDQAADIVRMMRARGLALEYISEQHMPHHYSLEDLKSRIGIELDETQLPAPIESLIADPEEDAALQQARIEAEMLEDL